MKTFEQIAADLWSHVEAGNLAQYSHDLSQGDLTEIVRAAIEADRTQRDEAFATLERVQARNALDLETVDDDSEFHQGIRHAAHNMAEILEAAPADALRERDAEKWDEGNRAAKTMLPVDPPRSIRNPYREAKE